MSAETVLPGDLARRVIDPHAYAAWDGLLDTFDHIPQHHAGDKGAARHARAVRSLLGSSPAMMT